MVKRNEKRNAKVTDDTLKQADRVVRISCVIALVFSVLINALYPNSVNVIVYAILGVAIIGKEAVYFFWPGGRR